LELGFATELALALELGFATELALALELALAFFVGCITELIGVDSCLFAYLRSNDSTAAFKRASAPRASPSLRRPSSDKT